MDINYIKLLIRVLNFFMFIVLVFFGFWIAGQEWGALLIIYTVPFSLFFGIFLLILIKKLRNLGFRSKFTKIYSILAVTYLLCVPNAFIALALALVVKSMCLFGC